MTAVIVKSVSLHSVCFITQSEETLQGMKRRILHPECPICGLSISQEVRFILEVVYAVVLTLLTSAEIVRISRGTVGIPSK